MQNNPIWKDTYYKSGDAVLDYKLVEDDEVIHNGYTKRMPDKTGVTVSINTRVEEYLNNDFETDFRLAGDDVILNPDAYKEYEMVDGNDSTLETYAFLYDWSYEDNWTGQTKYEMTNTINGHIDPRMKLKYTIYNTAQTNISWVITYKGIVKVDPESLLFNYSGGVKSFTVSANTEWSVASKPDWLTIGPTSGVGTYSSVTNTTVNCTASTHSGLTDRSGGIVIDYSDGTVIIPVKQYSDHHRIILSISGGTIDGYEQSIPFEIIAYSNWYVSSCPEWITVTPSSGRSGTSSGVVTVDEYLTKEHTSRTGTIVFRNSEGYEVSVTYIQNSVTYDEVYLRFEVISGGTIRYSGNKLQESFGYTSSTMTYRINKGEWHTITATTNTPAQFWVSNSDVVEFKASGNTYYMNGYGWYGFSGSTATFNISGNILSIQYGDNFRSYNALNGPFGCIFSDTMAVSAENLILPLYLYSGSTRTNNYAYAGMFTDCTVLTTAPDIPLPSSGVGTNTQLPDECYAGMFSGCTGLVNVPDLLATNLGDYCYYAMFEGCTSLVTAPDLGNPIQMKWHCYDSMFKDCTSLTVPPSLPATSLYSGCYYAMFEGCTSLTTAPELPASGQVKSDYYARMFYGCSHLVYIKCMAKSIYTAGAQVFEFDDWVYGVAESGTFVKNQSATASWSSGVNGIPNNWTVLNA